MLLIPLKLSMAEATSAQAATGQSEYAQIHLAVP
jgi:hypothetical protein